MGVRGFSARITRPSCTRFSILDKKHPKTRAAGGVVESRRGAVTTVRSVSTSRSSNRTGGFPASGSRTRTHAFAHGKFRVRTLSRTSPRVWYRYSSENRVRPVLRILCLAHNHRRSRLGRPQPVLRVISVGRHAVAITPAESL